MKYKMFDTIKWKWFVDIPRYSIDIENWFIFIENFLLFSFAVRRAISLKRSGAKHRPTKNNNEENEKH